MTPSPTTPLDSSTPYPGKDKVTFGNGNMLHISHIDQSLDVLVVTHLMKNLLSISKLTSIILVDVLFSKHDFAIQNRFTRATLAWGRLEHGIYILEQGKKAFVAGLQSQQRSASDKLWHNRLGHVAFDIIKLLNELWNLSITSLLPKPCISCQLYKIMCLPFELNHERLSNVLDLIHCDLWRTGANCFYRWL